MSLRSGDAPLTGPPAQRHRVALLSLIVASWPQPLPRDRAMALLWPERDLPSTRRLLNLAVHVLRAALGEGSIVTAGDGLLFEPAVIACDLHELRSAMARGLPAAVVASYGGTFLDGFHLPESADFAYWLDERRAELAHAYVGALRALAAEQREAGDWHAWIGTCRRLVAADPHCAANALALMEALDSAGDRAGAIRHAEEHARRMREELGLEPDAEVTGYAARLRTAPAPTLLDGDVPAVPTVAVLPFVAMDAAHDQDHVADGLTEDLIAHLAMSGGLRVIARASVNAFRDRSLPLREMARRLGATAVVDGSVRRAGERVRVVASLVDTEAGLTLWSASYDRDLADVFAIQSDVALRIARALEAELSHDEESRIRRAPVRDVQAYHLLLQGRRLFTSYTRNGMHRAVHHLEAALARDPTFALAHAYLGMTLAEFVEQGWMLPEVAYPRALAAASTALRLDPDLSEAHCALAHVRTVSEFDWQGAEQSFQKAIALSPSNAEAVDLYGRFCAGLGRHAEAIDLVRRAQQLDPLAHRLDVVSALMRAGRFDEAMPLARNAVELDPGHDRARATLGWAYFLMGRHDAGLAELEAAVEVDPRNSLWLGQLGEAYGLAGRTDRARAIRDDLETRARTEFVSPYHLAYVFTGLGEHDRAMDALDRAFERRTGAIFAIKGSFLFRPLHGHPRFRALLARMKVPPD